MFLSENYEKKMKKKNPKEIYPMTLSDNPFDHQETKMTIKQG